MAVWTLVPVGTLSENVWSAGYPAVAPTVKAPTGTTSGAAALGAADWARATLAVSATKAPARVVETAKRDMRSASPASAVRRRTRAACGPRHLRVRYTP